MSKALANLDKSTPNELQRTLRELTRELNSGKIKRGSKEWSALTEAIRSTKCFVPMGSEFINKNKVPHGINPLQHLTFICYCCGDPTRTDDLQVMSLASYQLLHSAMFKSVISCLRVQR